MRTVVVYVHGLWLNGWESLLLRQRLSRQLDCATLSFPYASLGSAFEENVRALAAFLGGLQGRYHASRRPQHGRRGDSGAVRERRGRSADAVQVPPGRIVLLGSPVRGSRAARNLAQAPFGRRILGLTAHEVLLPASDRRWPGARDLGVIAGNIPVGFGRFMGPFDSPSDGTVLVEETHQRREAASDLAHDPQRHGVLRARRAPDRLLLARWALCGRGASFEAPLRAR